MSLFPSSLLYVSAPGKIILFGEHAVVYRKTAIAGSIDLRTYLRLDTSADGRIYLCLPDLGIEKTWDILPLQRELAKLSLAETTSNSTDPPPLEIIVPIARRLCGPNEDQVGVQHLAVLAFWYLLIGVMLKKRDSSDLLAVKVTIRSKLPNSIGLGSSGAYCVCIATAFLQNAGLIPPPTKNTDENESFTWDTCHLETIRRFATMAESLIHGRASGLDAAICTYGGIAQYTKGSQIESLLSNIPELKIILINSRIERNTLRMVQAVKEALEKYPTIIGAIFDAIDNISMEASKILQRIAEKQCNSNTLTEPASCERPTSATLSIETNKKRGSSVSGISVGSSTDCRKNESHGTFNKLNDLCRINNHLLISLGVGHAKVDQICTLLARYGIHPKMTGAGGGGCLYAFTKPDVSQTVINMVRDELQKEGCELWQPLLGGPGVICHSQPPSIFTDRR